MIITKGKKSVSYLKNCLVMDYGLDSKINHTEFYNLQQALTSSDPTSLCGKLVYCRCLWFIAEEPEMQRGEIA